MAQIIKRCGTHVARARPPAPPAARTSHRSHVAQLPHGVVHPWVGQKLLKCNDFKRVYSRLRGTDESGDAAPLSEATADLS